MPVSKVDEFIEWYQLRKVLRTYYDIQKPRLQIENRILQREYIYCETCGLFCPKPKEAKRRRKGLAEDQCPRCGSKGVYIVEVEPPKVLQEIHDSMLKYEKMIYRVLYDLIKEHPLWKLYLKHIAGIGPVMGAFLIFELNPARFETWSKMIKYCLLHVEHICSKCGARYDQKIDVCPKCGGTIIHRAPRREKGRKLGGSLFARTMCYRLSLSFVRRGKFYRYMFQRFLEEISSKRPNITPMHRMRDAMRRTVKLFLGHYYEVGRTILGLPVRTVYPVAKKLDGYIPPVLDKKEVDDVMREGWLMAILKQHGVTEDEYRRFLNEFQNWLVKVKKVKVGKKEEEVKR